MILSEYTLEIFADADGTIDPDRLTGFLKDAGQLQGGGLTAPLEYIPPIDGGDPRAWGLRVRLVNEEPDA